MYAVIQTGGKQYKVKEGETLKIEKLDVEEGKNVDLDVLMVADEEGKNVKVGTPTLSGAKVTAKVIGQGRSKKIEVVKYKPKSRYKRTNGHRQYFTKVEITKITA